MSDVSVPDLDAMGPRRVRAAVWRGVVRTALVVVVALVALNTLIPLASKGWQNRGSHDARFFDIVSKALVARHPGWQIEGSGCCEPGRRFDLRFEVGLRPPDLGRPNSGRSQVQVTVRQDWRGHVADVDGDIEDFGEVTGQLFMRQNSSKADTLALLDQLPVASTIVAVVTFKKPLAAEDVSAPSPLTYFLEPVLHAADSDKSTVFPNPLAFSWPVFAMEELQPWASRLRHHDERNLFGFSVDKVRKIARHPRVYAAIYDHLSPTELRSLVEADTVDRVAILDAALETDPAEFLGGVSLDQPTKVPAGLRSQP